MVRGKILSTEIFVVSQIDLKSIIAIRNRSERLRDFAIIDFKITGHEKIGYRVQYEYHVSETNQCNNVVINSF